MTHICVSELTTIGSDNGLSPGRRQTIIWTNAGILLIWPKGTNFGEMLFEIQTFSFKNIDVKMSSAKWQPYCVCLNVLTLFFSMTKLWENNGALLVIQTSQWLCGLSWSYYINQCRHIVNHTLKINITRFYMKKSFPSWKIIYWRINITIVWMKITFLLGKWLKSLHHHNLNGKFPSFLEKNRLKD